jgi:hypothetical protein
VSVPRRAQLTRGELRATLLEAGREILLEEGLDTDSTNLTFKRVFDRVETQTGVRITNASVIRRVWENQADFQTDVLVAIAHDENRPEAERTVQALLDLFRHLDLSTPEARDDALGEVCRVGGEASNTAIADSTSFSLWISVMAMATATALPDERRRIQDALRSAYGTVDKFWGEAYAGLAALLGLRIRQPWTIGHFVMAVTALNEGFALRARINGHIEWVTRPTGPDGEDQEWTLFAAALEALARQFFETDPDFTPPPLPG